MGQRSQIYVRVDNKLYLARYFRWNYGERMISRARWGIEALSNYVEQGFNLGTEKERFARIFDVNFDMHDVAISADIMEEYREYGSNGKMNFNKFVFTEQDNNDGKLLISVDTKKPEIKYAFLNSDSEYIGDVHQYIQWDIPNFMKDLILDDLITLRGNCSAIEIMAKLMTQEEAKEFISLDEEGNPVNIKNKSLFRINYTEYSEMFLDIEAENAAEARETFEQMCYNDEVDFTELQPFDSEIKVDEIKEEKFNF